jgi:hypothetical protein
MYSPEMTVDPALADMPPRCPFPTFRSVPADLRSRIEFFPHRIATPTKG